MRRALTADCNSRLDERSLHLIQRQVCAADFTSQVQAVRGHERCVAFESSVDLAMTVVTGGTHESVVGLVRSIDAEGVLGSSLKRAVHTIEARRQLVNLHLDATARVYN